METLPHDLVPGLRYIVKLSFNTNELNSRWGPASKQNNLKLVYLYDQEKSISEQLWKYLWVCGNDFANYTLMYVSIKELKRVCISK